MSAATVHTPRSTIYFVATDTNDQSADNCNMTANLQAEENQPAAVSQSDTTASSDPATRAATQRVERILEDLSTEITEVIKTININIDQQRAELYVCLPEFGRVLSGLMEDHALYITLVMQLASKLGDHGLAEEKLQEEARLEAEVDEAYRMVDIFAIDEEDQTETQVLAAPTSQDILDRPAQQPVVNNADTIQFAKDTEVGLLTPATQTKEPPDPTWIRCHPGSCNVDEGR